MVFTIDQGWTFVLGSADPQDGSALRGVLEPFGTRFGKAFWFANHRVASCYGWARVDDDAVTRAFYTADHNCLFNVGERTTDEVAEGIGTADEKAHHHEDHVIEMATRWTVNPQMIRAGQVVGPFLIGVKAAD